MINNEWFKALPKRYFHMWYTENGPLQVTCKEHAVVIIGFDADFVYFSDPLRPQKNRRVLKRNFIAGWKRLGAQAVTDIFPEKFHTGMAMKACNGAIRNMII